jgi:hypothetical protein
LTLRTRLKQSVGLQAEEDRMSVVSTRVLRWASLVQSAGLAFGLSLGLATILTGCGNPKTESLRPISSSAGTDYVHLFFGPPLATESDAESKVRHFVAVRGLSSDRSAGMLDVLAAESAEEPVRLVQASTAFWQTLQISPAGPEYVLFVDSVNQDGVGKIKFVDLGAAEISVADIPDKLGEKALPYGIFFGATGNQMLFVSGVSGKTGVTGTLYYWTGSGAPTKLAEKANPAVMLFSTDRKKALTTVNYSRDTLRGDLVLIDMESGSLTPIGSKVVIDAKVFGVEGFVGQSITLDRLNLAFSAAPDLSSIVYTTLEAGAGKRPQVYRWPAAGGGDGRLFENAEHSVPADGIFPAISPSGKVITYFEFLPSSNGIPGNIYLHVWSLSTGGDVYKVKVPAGTAMCPKISADDRFILVLTDVSIAGANGSSTALGTLNIVPTSLPAGTDPKDILVRLQRFVDWGSVRFAPNFVNQPTTSLSFIANMKDMARAPALSMAQGDIFWTQLERGFPEGFEQPVATGIFPDAVFPLPEVNGLAFEKGGFFGEDVESHPYVWVPGMTEARQLDRNERAGFHYKPGSLKTSGIIPSLKLRPAIRPDSIGYVTVPVDGSDDAGGTLRAVQIRTGGEQAVDVDTDATRQTYSNFFFDPTGRILGFLAVGGNASTVQVWDLPFPSGG